MGKNDMLSPAARSERMSRIRSSDTALELKFRQALWAAGVRGWRCNVVGVFGRPDLCWKGRRVAVFLDSAWWHGHESRWKPGRLGKYWDEKIERNIARDIAVNENLRQNSWTVLRFWDFEIDGDLERCVGEVASALSQRARESA